MIPEVLRHLGKAPATVNYPLEKVDMPAHFRGRLTFHPDRCRGCMLCTKDCPAAAIKIVKTGDREFQAEIDLDRCIYCAQCVDSCTAGALESTRDFELARLDRAELKVIYRAGSPAGAKPEGSPEEKA
jgi:formate hydrogenlyase subunit 6/NADH:ubiquinone oxidoreductase subunit I